MIMNMSKTAWDIVALNVSGSLKKKTEALSAVVKRGNNSLLKAGRNSGIVFPIIVSDDISDDVAYDIGKDAECTLALATKAFIEKKVSRDAKDLDIDDIISSLPIYNNVSSVADIRDLSNAMLAESCMIANNLFDEATDGVDIIAEAANIDILKDKGSTGTYITIRIPYIARGGKDGTGGEIKNLEVVMEFDGIIRKVGVEELATRIGTFDHGRFFKSFIKLSKKEIAFTHDFLLEIDRLKLEARASAKSDRLWKDLTMKNRAKDIFVSSYPFTVIVISDEVGENILDKYMIDVRSAKHLKAVMESFSAFTIYSVNNSNNLVDVLKDGDSMIKTIPLDDMTKASSKIDRKLKELIKLG